MGEEQCRHEFREVKKTKQEWKKNYVSSGHGYDYKVLEHEEVYIFCIKCGESRRIDIGKNKK